ncbi:MAG: leucyl aminopeptidase family protein [Cyanobacteria bacterium]|nr:leucyl aminopeptidase family protein [Cyanobacteriota bacterium]
MTDATLGAQPIPLILVKPNQIADHCSAAQSAWVKATGFRADRGAACLLPNDDGGIDRVLVGRGKRLDTWLLGDLAQTLPPHPYTLATAVTPAEATHLGLGWRLGQYRFNRYHDRPPSPTAELILPTQADTAYIDAAVEATYLARDLITTPANDMGPAQLEETAQGLAVTYGADLTVIAEGGLEVQNYPLIYAVGRASVNAPRLLDLRWGDFADPKVTLVGKGVCFDSGGLDIKSAQGMRMMKKDMGGAAHVLGLALMIMKLNLPVRLRVLVPAVENSIAGNAMRPLDVLPSRKGETVEVGNTDAEGRLVLADALWEATSEQPELLVDFATLTGAARVALGTELPAFFCNHGETAAAFQTAMQSGDDPLWQLPLHQPYRELLNSKIADLSNISSGSYGGAITAALFLQEFVKPDIPWIHIDVMAWNIRSLPGRPEGGEAMGIRSVFELIRQRFEGELGV